MLDAARPDHFSCYGYPKPTTPQIDRLAARGAIFLNNYAQATTTRTSVPRLLYSRYFAPEIFPNHHAIPFTNPGNLFRKIDDEAMSLPRALEANGVVTAAISAHEWITAESPFAREFTFLFDLQSTIPFDRSYGYPRADKVVDQAVDWIWKNRSRDFFLYLHVMDTHFPHFFQGDARTFFGSEPYTGGAFGPEGLTLDVNRSATAEDRKYLNALYDGGLRYADRELGRLFATLEDWGVLDQTLIVITADHGEFLLDRKGYMTHGGPWYEPLARVPLIIHYPLKVSPGRRDALTESIDIAPTLLKLLGISLPEGSSFDGRDVFQEQAKRSRAMSEGGIRDERYKLIFKSSGTEVLGPTAPAPKAANAELYDLAADPKETRNLAAESPAVVERLLSAYRAQLQRPWIRFQAATTHDQPRQSFAIAAPAFGGDAEIPFLPVEENPANLQQTPTPSGWLGRATWDNSWLFAKRGAKPLHISFPMPKGRYFLVADIWGAVQIEINGQKVLLQSDALSADLRRDPKPIDIGEIELKGETFSAILYPQPTHPWFAIRYLGFNPVINGKRGGYYDKEREERLRSLGYIR
ncbi:MAG: sulfatase-like hydrolase/transferase [Acidobacteria bacterium]|nr:sulfatase-like hydrolase/transferase [Acidobacteriota bacterium]